MNRILIVFVILLFSIVECDFITCGSPCESNSNCTQYVGNPCTYCDRGKCTPVCGLGCGDDDDCKIGEGNPCTMCSERRVCINPVPGCGSFCGGYNEACRFPTGECAGAFESCCTCHPTNMTKGCGNHTIHNNPTCGSYCDSDSDCSNASDDCTECSNNQCSSNICGMVCSGSGQCQSDSQCPECVGYFCSEKASCGQVCLSSGQCNSNPGNCKACIGTICDNYVSCGGSCGGDDWCSPSCPVCSNFAKCSTSSNHLQWIANASNKEIEQWKIKMEEIQETKIQENIRKYKKE